MFSTLPPHLLPLQEEVEEIHAVLVRSYQDFSPIQAALHLELELFPLLRHEFHYPVAPLEALLGELPFEPEARRDSLLWLATLLAVAAGHGQPFVFGAQGGSFEDRGSSAAPQA